MNSDLSYWRGGQFQHHPKGMWLQSAAELKKSAQLLDLPTGASERHNSTAKEQLETEWEMCRQEYDARIALMMLMEGRKNNSTAGSNSPTGATLESRPPAQLMKLLDGGETATAQVRSHFFSEDTNINLPQVWFKLTS